MKKALVQESDSTVQTLENEWKTLLQQEEQQVREAQKEKEARLIREQEEQARLAKEREEAKAKAKLTPEGMVVTGVILFTLFHPLLSSPSHPSIPPLFTPPSSALLPPPPSLFLFRAAIGGMDRMGGKESSERDDSRTED